MQTDDVVSSTEQVDRGGPPVTRRRRGRASYRRTATVRSSLIAVMAAAALVWFAGCGGSDASVESDRSTAAPTGGLSGETAGERITIDGDEALLWGDGPSGVVLAHGAAFDAASWEDQAVQFAEQGRTVVAVESLATAAIDSAVAYLRDDVGVEEVTLIGGSAGADAILQLVSGNDQVDPSQLILLAPTGVVQDLGTEPKLFIASEGDPVADVSTELADSADGSDNEVLIVAGSAHAQNMFDTNQGQQVTDAILDRLERVGGVRS